MNSSLIAFGDANIFGLSRALMFVLLMGNHHHLDLHDDQGHWGSRCYCWVASGCSLWSFADLLSVTARQLGIIIISPFREAFTIPTLVFTLLWCSVFLSGDNSRWLGLASMSVLFLVSAHRYLVNGTTLKNSFQCYVLIQYSISHRSPHYVYYIVVHHVLIDKVFQGRLYDLMLSFIL